MKRMERTIEEMKSLMGKQEQNAYYRALNELSKNRDAAIAVGDVATVKHIDQQMASVKQPEIQANVPSAALDFNSAINVDNSDILNSFY